MLWLSYYDNVEIKTYTDEPNMMKGIIKLKSNDYFITKGSL